MNLAGPWHRERVDDFLADARIPVRVGCRTPNDDPWMVSLWYAWDGDALHCATGADADLVDFLAHDDAVSFEVSTNAMPYRGVRGRGEATVTPDTDKQQLRGLLERYLGGTDNPLGERLLDPDREEVHIRIDPVRLRSWDFTGRMPEREAVEPSSGEKRE